MTNPSDITFDNHISDEEGEGLPLLQESRSSISNAYPSIHLHEATSPRTIIAILFSIIFILQFGGDLVGVPQMRLYENVVCHHYYNGLKGVGHIGYGEHIDESMCKVVEVQNELNIVFAGAKMLDAISSLVLTIPYGLMMDRVGRKPVFLLSMAGLMMSFSWDVIVMRFWQVIPLRLVWAAPLFTLLGGGNAVAIMVVHTIGSDVTTEANRANVFLFGASASLAADLIGPTLASTLMVKTPWTPYLIGWTIMLLGSILVNFIPETLQLRGQATQSEDVTPDSMSERSLKFDDSSFFAAIKSHISDAWRRLAGSVSVLCSIPVILLLLTFFIYSFNLQSADLCIRYISNRFSWSLSQAGYLLSLRALINIFVMLGLLPGLSYYFIERKRLSSKEKDLLLAKASILMLVIGVLLIAASPTIELTVFGLTVWTFGTGFLSLTRSLITTLVDEQHIGRLYGAISIIETAGALIAGPAFASLYNLGLRKSGPWVGLPFFLSAGVSFMAAVELWVFGCVTRGAPRQDTACEDGRENIRQDTLFLEPNIVA